MYVCVCVGGWTSIFSVSTRPPPMSTSKLVSKVRSGDRCPSGRITKDPVCQRFAVVSFSAPSCTAASPSTTEPLGGAEKPVKSEPSAPLPESSSSGGVAQASRLKLSLCDSGHGGASAAVL